jgi:hypothetical protein
VVGHVVRARVNSYLLLIFLSEGLTGSCEVQFAANGDVGSALTCSKTPVEAGKAIKSADGVTYNCGKDDCNKEEKTALEALIPVVTTTLAPGAVSSQISAYSYSFVSWSVCHHGIVLIVELILIYRRRSSSVT